MSADRIAAWILLLSSALLSGCNLFGTQKVVDAARVSFSSDMSPEIRRQLERLRDVPYGQLYVRYSGQEEAVFLLAEQNLPGGYDLWIGSSGVKLAMQGASVRYTEGMLTDITASQSVRNGSVAVFLRRESDEIRPQDPSIVWLKTSESDQWVEQTAVVESIEEVLYAGMAYTGTVLKVVERVWVTGQRGDFERLLWIEPRTRSLLRMSTRIGTDDRPIVLEWVRVPDRADPR